MPLCEAEAATRCKCADQQRATRRGGWAV